jgi:probable F420-dependent oxidoreductase
MHISLFGLHRGSSVDPDVLARRARLAEDAGLEAIWVGDHIALPFDAPDSAVQPRLEALTVLTFLAAVTTRVRLGVGVIVLPQRQPVLLAKQLASIDVLSKGRLTVGIGAGYVERELRALGASLADRGARTDEYLAAIRALWADGGKPPAFDGRFVSFAEVVQRPLPVQRPHPPIVIGGHSAAAYRRAVTSGNGWYGWDLDVEATARTLGELRDAASRAVRPPELGELEITITPPGPPDLDTARRYAELGVHRLTFQPSTMDGDAIETLIATLGDTLVGRV